MFLQWFPWLVNYTHCSRVMGIKEASLSCYVLLSLSLLLLFQVFSVNACQRLVQLEFNHFLKITGYFFKILVQLEFNHFFKITGYRQPQCFYHQTQSKNTYYLRLCIKSQYYDLLNIMLDKTVVKIFYHSILLTKQSRRKFLSTHMTFIFFTRVMNETKGNGKKALKE